jgi:antitoxin ParD1/3/4
MLLGEHFEQFIKAQLANGRYANGSEVVRETPRLLEDRGKLRAIQSTLAVIQPVSAAAP